MLNPIDAFILVVLAVSLGVAFLRGLVQESVSLATWIAAAAAGYDFDHLVRKLIELGLEKHAG